MDETLKLFFDTALKELKEIREKELPEIRKTQNKHDQTLYGETGNNGMRKDVSWLKKMSYVLLGASLVIGSALFWKLFFAI